MNKPAREKGYTLLELIMVLSIVVLLTGIMLPFGNQWVKERSEKEAIKMFIAAVHQMQANSYAQNNYAAIKFTNAGRTYQLYAPDHFTMLSEVDLPPTMKFVSRVNPAIEFSGGSVREFRTLTFETKSGRRIEVKIQIGHGRMIVHEE